MYDQDLPRSASYQGASKDSSSSKPAAPKDDFETELAILLELRERRQQQQQQPAKNKVSKNKKAANKKVKKNKSMKNMAVNDKKELPSKFEKTNFAVQENNKQAKQRYNDSPNDIASSNQSTSSCSASLQTASNKRKLPSDIEDAVPEVPRHTKHAKQHSNDFSNSPAVSNQTVVPQTMSPQEMSHHIASSQTVSPHIASPQIVRTQTVRTQIVSPQTVRSQTVNYQTVKRQTANIQNVNSQAVNNNKRKSPLDIEDTTAEVLRQTKQSKKSDNDFSNSPAVNDQTVNPETANLETINPQALNPQTVKKQEESSTDNENTNSQVSRNTMQPSHHNRNKNKEKKPFVFVPKKDCIHFLKGYCKQGDACKFKHDPAAVVKPVPKTKTTVVCQFVKTGSCTRFDDCPFSHDLSIEPCRFYYMDGECKNNMCPYYHAELTKEKLERLRKLTGPCRFYFFKGYCKTGEDCLFSHDHDAYSEDALKKVESGILLCKYYHLKGNCKRGDNCFYLHDEATVVQIEELKKSVALGK